MDVTGESADPEFDRVVVDGDEQHVAPVPHRKVTAHFEGSDARFTVHLPHEGWQHRFHHPVYPLDDEQPDEATIATAAAAGAYLVRTNSPGGYRIDAAAAKASRVIATEHYDSSQRIFGYLHGASGGGFQTIGAMENTAGVWDGAVPMVIGVPTSIPNNFFVRALARFVLSDKAEVIADAVRPGGSGDPFVHLDDAEAEVLQEVMRMGVPLRAFDDHPYVFGRQDPDLLMGFAPVVRELDPTYADDFWSAEGYLGTEPSALGERFREARTGENDWDLALLTYHRHQVPARDGHTAFDQFRDASGRPSGPQRPIEIGPLISGQVCGTGDRPSHTGALSGKVILLQNLLDPDGWPAHGAWYHQQVRRSLGAGADDSFRLWFNDHADHFAGPEAVGKEDRIVDYAGICQQALRDVAAWVERDEAPAPSTTYEVVDGQVEVAVDARRGGIQPVVDLNVEGRSRVEVAIGTPVHLHAEVSVPRGTGRIVAAEWGGLDPSIFTPADLDGPTDRAVITTELTFDRPGTYFPAMRVIAERDEASPGLTGIPSLGRVRVVVV